MAGSADPLSDPGLARELSQRYLIFDSYVAGIRRVELHPLVLPLEMHEAAARAAESVVATIGRVTGRAYIDPAERARYRLSKDSERLAAASYESGDHGSLMRVDLLLGEDGQWRACEINADCPGGHNESLGLPELARDAGFRGGSNPTHMLESLAERLAALAELPGEPPGVIALVYATAYAEDLQVCAIVQRLLHKRGTRALLVSPLAPRFDTGELRVGAEIVRVLYRYFPTEYKERLVGERSDWVLKRAFGRVGDEVFVGPLFADDQWGEIVRDVSEMRESGESWIAQRFVPQRSIPTPWGERLVTLGAYVLDGRFVGYFTRITSESHVSHGALCVPVFTEAA